MLFDTAQAAEKSLHLSIEFNVGFVVIFIFEEVIENAAARMLTGAAGVTAAFPAIAKRILGGLATCAVAFIVRCASTARSVARAVVEIAHSVLLSSEGACPMSRFRVSPLTWKKRAGFSGKLEAAESCAAGAPTMGTRNIVLGVRAQGTNRHGECEVCR